METVTAKEDTRTRVERLIVADPSLTTDQLAAALDVTRQRIHQILRELGFRQEWRRPEP